jgi:hypothetical protein
MGKKSDTNAASFWFLRIYSQVAKATFAPQIPKIDYTHLHFFYGSHYA